MQLDPAATGADTVVAIARYALIWAVGATIIAGATVGVLRWPRPDQRLSVNPSRTVFSGPCRPGGSVVIQALPPPTAVSLRCRIRGAGPQWSSRIPLRGG